MRSGIPKPIQPAHPAIGVGKIQRGEPEAAGKSFPWSCWVLGNTRCLLQGVQTHTPQAAGKAKGTDLCPQGSVGLQGWPWILP